VASNVFLWQLTQKLPKRPDPELHDEHEAEAAPAPPVVPTLLEPVSVRMHAGAVGLVPSLSFA
jgi:hypothetical protein